ncbi:unnamed protein product [Heterobilharzia americana]|nr:unnamed protein product [Heterobilharzia americana]
MLQANDLKRVQGDENASESLCQKTSKFGVGTQGAFRVAWSDMPEVIESTCLQRLTRHEIQLQEAMFEVITSEASYYQSLNVLVNHFYHAPEFECEPLNHTSVQTNQVPNKVCKDPGSPMSCGVGQQDFISFSSQTTTDPNAASATTGTVTNNASSNTANNTTANSNNADSSDFCLDTGNQTPACNTRRPLLKPLEKHHLFSNVLLVCLASEMFLRDLEARWESRMPILNEVCDLIVKHAGGVNFEPYITYLRNQTYQMATLRKLCKRDSFRAALENLHAHPRSGKNLITSFLALPMQRLTRLKLLVEVIRRLQDAVIRDSMDKTLEKRPFRVPSDRERENVQLALRELNRLLTASETEKELMDRKSRLLTLSSSLEFPDNVKRIAISDKRLIKEGELRENFSDSVRLSVLQKLAIRKPNLFYLILFNDLLLVTRKKKNERFLVLDYCDRASVQAFVQRNGDLIGTSTNLLKNPKNSISAEPLCIIEPCTDDIQLNTQKTKRFLSPDSEDTSKNLKCTAKDKRHRRHKTTNDFDDLITPKTSDSNNDNNNGVRTEPSRVQSYVETSKNVETSKVSNTDGIPTSITPATTSNNLTGLPSATTTTTAATSVTTTPTTVFMSSATSTKKINLSRSGSSLSGYHLRFNHERIRNIKSNIFSTPQSNMNALVNCKTGTIHLKLLGSHNGTCSELVLLPKDDREFESWCKAFSLSLDSPY